MSDRKPLVLGDEAVLQQLQVVDDLDIPLRERVNQLELELSELRQALLLQGIELPERLEKI